MIIKYISFLIGIIWSYSIIKTQSIFSKKTGIFFKIFITKVSWFTLIAACYFGYKNFSIKSSIFGVIIGVLIVNIGFYYLKKLISQRLNKNQIITYKKFFEYTLIFLVIYFVLF
jgi:hypothetical protein|tara:strand:+ start:558 stop:899 length:342 start_codon:yes stop_codon:yes gene_type:complete